MKAFRSIPIFLLVFILVECKPIQKTALDQLGNVTWILQELNGNSAILELFPEGPPTLNFNDTGTLSGFTGCNNFSGIYSLEESELKLDPGAMTRKACSDVKEDEFLQALEMVNSLEVDQNKLILKSPEGGLMTLVSQN
ncbi:META domain-containing protein [Algoriphagus lutimaris]|uniref:META domain-containing protein n=1 Tax=Algoriphagus lutimaris TaxID=613197 RepID=UPI00196B4E85|nr:META domain-containing protein [Algoriphagus lutimaris]MBN3520575.1 META domain-containing protein [Algoriphagus lutimaris]